MPISVNEGGTLYELDTVHSNEGGTLYEIHKAAMEAVWTSFSDSDSPIISQANSKNSTTCSYYVNWIHSYSTTTPDTVKCTFNMKAGQTLSVDSVIDTGNQYVPTMYPGTARLYDNSNNLLASWSSKESYTYNTTTDLKNCYAVFKFAKQKVGQTIIHTITLTIE